MFGIINDFEFTRHRSLISYYYAIRNLYGEPKQVKCIDDLEGVNTLFMGDDHHQPHRDIWQAPGFIERCNENNIRLIVFTTERIFNSFFPWNEDIYKELKRFNNLHHFVCDADDAKLLGVQMNRVALSRDLQNNEWRRIKKFNKMVFIGRTDCMLDSYRERKLVIEEVLKEMNLTIIEPTFERWEDYMEKLAHYRFVFCPVGNGNIITTKFYEALMVGSIPVQQIRDNTLDLLPVERGLDDCIYFQNIQGMKVNMKNIKRERSHNLIFMEDVIREEMKGIL